MKFFDEKHKNKYLEFINKDQTEKGDVERLAVLYILSSEYLRDVVDEIYDFDKHQIKYFREGENDIETIKVNPNYCRAASVLTCLAFHLFSFINEEGVAPANIFYGDNQTNFIALNVMKIRYEMDTE